MAYGILQKTAQFHEMHFLIQTLAAWVISFGVVCALSRVKPRGEKWVLPEEAEIDLKPSKLAMGGAIGVVVAVAVFYVIFW